MAVSAFRHLRLATNNAPSTAASLRAVLGLRPIHAVEDAYAMDGVPQPLFLSSTSGGDGVERVCEVGLVGSDAGAFSRSHK